MQRPTGGKTRFCGADIHSCPVSQISQAAATRSKYRRALNTGDEIMLERKGIDAVPVANHIRLIVTSNADWVVPATQDERRFFVLSLTDEHRLDTAWFGAIEHEFRNGGVEAFLYDLMNFDYSHLDLRNPPRTPPLVEQMAET